MYIRIRKDFEFWLKAFLYFWIIADGIFFYVLPFYKYSGSMPPRAVMGVIPYAIFAYIMMVGKYKDRAIDKYKFVSIYILMSIIISIIIILYSIITYNQSFIAVFTAGHYYFSLISVSGYLLLFEIDENEFYKMLRIVAIFGAINTMIVLFCALSADFGVPIIFKGFTSIGFRDGHTRAAYRAMSYYSFIYYFANVLRKDCKARLIKVLYLGIGLFGMVYVVNTRIVIISMAVALTCILVLNTERKVIKYLSYVVIVVLVIYAIFSNQIDTIFSSFSVDSELGGSTLARIIAIDYFSTFTKDNPLFGMGIVYPSTPELRLIFSGPTGTSYFDDLGIMGGYFRLGLLGMFVIIVPLLRMLYLTFKIYRNKLPYSSLFVGIMAYILVSQVSLNYLDFQRAIIASFYWAIMEFYYRKKKEELEL